MFKLRVRLGFSLEYLLNNVVLVEILCLLFGGWLCLFAKERLPAYYDENKISFFSDGIFRINLAGTRFLNRNWPHILHAGRIWLLLMAVLFLALHHFFLSLWAQAGLYFTLAATLGAFVPMLFAAKRYE